VIDMALLSVIRRWHFRQQIPIREIDRRTGLSRNTIHKYLRSDAAEPQFKIPDRSSKLDPFAEKLTGWFRGEFRTPLGVRKSPKHESAVAMHGLMGISEFGLIVLGVYGGLEAVQDQHARHFGGRSRRRLKAIVPQSR
jgi:hypothetical protein